MSESLLAVCIGLLAALITWSLSVTISRPNLRLSEFITVQSPRATTRTLYQAKVVNLRPWSARNIAINLYLIAPDVSNVPVVVRLVVTDPLIPIVGGWAFRRVRIGRYGWLGASHRILTFDLQAVPSFDLKRLRPDHRRMLSAAQGGYLESCLQQGAELVLVVSCQDGLLLGKESTKVKVYRDAAAKQGTFQRGRSLDVAEVKMDSEETRSSSRGITIDDGLLLELGLGALPDHVREQMRRYMYEQLEQSVGSSLASRMSDSQLDEFEKLFDAKDDAGAFRWLEHEFPDYKTVVKEKFDELKSKLAESAPSILAAEGVANLSEGSPLLGLPAGAREDSAPGTQSREAVDQVGLSNNPSATGP